MQYITVCIFIYISFQSKNKHSCNYMKYNYDEIIINHVNQITIKTILINIKKVLISSNLHVNQ